MGIDAEVGQAYHTVQLSTKEMLKNNRRQNYCSVSNFHAAFCCTQHFLAASTMTSTIIILVNLDD